MVQLAVRTRLDARRWALLDLQGVVESNTDDLRGLAAGDLAVAADVRSARSPTSARARAEISADDRAHAGDARVGDGGRAR